ncbi:phosphatase PAP2 family protein [Sphingomonas humi]|uniref:phosphatase PAP2 family protein n=1 Tax=Sphingomonas humi TaxID=335630 RepID=UPI0031E2E9E6
MRSAAVVAAVAAAAMALAARFHPPLRHNWKTKAVWLLTATLVVGQTFASYAMFKQVLLPQRGFLWDQTFAHIGRTLFGGTSPWVITHAVFGSVGGSRFLNALYSAWLAIIFIYPLFAGACVNDRRLRFQMIASWLGAWIFIGTIAAWYFASAGPVFYNALIGPDPDYHSLQMRLSAIEAHAASEGNPIQTLQFQPMLLELYHRRVFDSVGGISAMPSMHVALATLLALTGFAKGRLLGFVLSGYAFLIWVGSVHFGWHYFVDGPVAAVLMAVVWKATGLAYRGLEEFRLPALRLGQAWDMGRDPCTPDVHS